MTVQVQCAAEHLARHHPDVSSPIALITWREMQPAGCHSTTSGYLQNALPLVSPARDGCFQHRASTSCSVDLTRAFNQTCLTCAGWACSIPGLIEQVIRPPMGGAGLTIYIQLYNTIFFFVFASVLYAAVRHKRPQHAQAGQLSVVIWFPHGCSPQRLPDRTPQPCKMPAVLDSQSAGMGIPVHVMGTYGSSAW